MKKVLLLCLVFIAVVTADQAVVFDESTPGLTYIGEGGNWIEPGATPYDGVTYNEITFKNGSATATIDLQAGQTYRITSRRKVNDNWSLPYHVSINGQLAHYDAALAMSAPAESYQSYTYLGYYTATSNSTVVSAHDGGSSYTRLDYLSFEVTTDVFFDELTTPTYSGTAGLTGIKGCMGHGSNDNGFGLGAADTVSGSVSLTAGTLYNVYASRATHSVADAFGYDLNLDGVFFAHDDALSGGYFDDSGWAEEVLLGQFTASSAATAVEFLNGGGYAARIDNLRFEAVPEPATMAILAAGLLFVRKKKC